MSEKSPQIEAILKSLMPLRGVEGVCATCGSQEVQPQDFRDEISRKEFTISQMCQVCQDSVFNCEEDEDYDV